MEENFRCNGYPEGSHEEIIYDGGECPLCHAIDRIRELKEEREKLQIENEELKLKIFRYVNFQD